MVEHLPGVHEVVDSAPSTGSEGGVRYCLVPVCNVSGLELTLRASFKVNTVK